MHIVVFHSTKTSDSGELYMEWGQKMAGLVKEIPGYVSHHGFFDKATNKGVTIGYFESEDAIALWRDHPDHVKARDLGREKFYEEFTLEVAKIERSYSWSRSGS